MDVIREDDVVLVLRPWEANDLRRMLQRIRSQPVVGKSEFTLREKRTGRKILDLVTDRLIPANPRVD